MKQKNIIIIFFVGLLLLLAIYLNRTYEGIENSTPAPTTTYIPITTPAPIIKPNYTKDSVLSYLNEVDASMADYLKSMFDEPATCPQVTMTTPGPTCPPLPTCPQPELIKCIADYGTNIGDPLSGGKGVLQDTRYVCPNTLKKCTHFKCGSAFGTCTSGTPSVTTTVTPTSVNTTPVTTRSNIQVTTTPVTTRSNIQVTTPVTTQVTTPVTTRSNIPVTTYSSNTQIANTPVTTYSSNTQITTPVTTYSSNTQITTPVTTYSSNTQITTPVTTYFSNTQ